MSDVIDSLMNHRSIRRYKNKAIEPFILNKLLQVGLRAPSSGNLQNWDRYYEKLSDEKKKHWNEELGVYNNVQYISKTVYTEERVTEWGDKIAANLKKAKFGI